MLSERFANRLNRANSVAVLTGAGASAESGVPTFRDPAGLWEDHDPEELASMSGFLSDPIKVQSWYTARIKAVTAAEPHAGHYALAEIEQLVPRFTLVTQNVDGLHARAGSINTLEVHGSLLRWRCVSCGANAESASVEPDASEPARCTCGELVRPSVVWFGEMLDGDLLSRARAAALSCDVFLSVGTGAEVFPAASLPLVAADNGAYVVEVNPEETAISSQVDELIRGKAGDVLPAIANVLTSKVGEVN